MRNPVRILHENGKVRTFNSHLLAAIAYGLYEPFSKNIPSFLQSQAWFELKGLDLKKVN